MTFKRFLSNVRYSLLEHPLGLLCTLALVLYAVLLFVVPHPDVDNLDAFILLYLAVMATSVSVSIAVRTQFHGWTFLNSGLFAVFIGLVILASSSAVTTGLGPYEHRETVISAARAFLTLGCTWVMIGLVLEWWYENGMTRRLFLRAIRHPIKAYTNRHAERETYGVSDDQGET